ncbi:MAG: bacillithiol biosynthesis deacetylase BshB1 [Flavobacteriales bacterium]|nr:bacillithiol biosynthesis deacetylase BshB1 [Flavobacteriales bacterium]
MVSGVDILCLTAHPDDVEISAAGTVLHHAALGRTVGIVDLTVGELGTRGNGPLRQAEAEAARLVLGAAFRYQLDLPDGFFRADRETLMKVVEVVRRHRPRLVITNAVRDRHPDHGRASALVTEACFLSGLPKVVTTADGVPQAAHRPLHVLHMVQDRWIDPQVIVDVSAFWPRKLEALRCFASQFHDPESTEPLTPIAGREFFDVLEGRARAMGRLIGVEFGEGFTTARPVGVGDLLSLS